MKIGDKVRISSNKEDIPLDYRGAEGLLQILENNIGFV